MSTTTQLMTADELFELPRRDFQCELIEGELRRMQFFGGEHGAVVAILVARVGAHVEANGLGLCVGTGTGFIISRDPDTVRAPDLAFVRRERVPAEGVPKKFWPGAPDLAVEVLSPGDTYSEVEEKVEGWLAAGARAVWVLNPKRRNVTVYRTMTDVTRLSESDELDGGEVVPGFRCKVSELFV
jgi:Uma2 family endonuclease